ncbi:deoxyribose-phosphate aldolase [Mahella australiensis]|uniref:Deoxyribose-phosphate aldolase n=1 Tax=Mahella australiensis (strain DSM 15567 / CIP 107919 / 50-1 BON) TaxID=697281 RepID=F4A0U0_MAHA5|nr:deoxyribose-phosphate aldolase [Mahella australiensis]AEE96986.1 deoxyribose-phosphate aldolase [Mahella australiensis 50-1 BON]
MLLTVKDIAKMIDHSLLKPELTIKDVIEGCNVAKLYDVAAVCVRPCDVKLAKEQLEGSSIKIAAVIGFPHGSNKTDIKVFEANTAIDEGATELDMVLNIGRLRSLDFEYVEHDIRAVTDAAHARNAIVKVILENCYLTDELKEQACRIAERAGADYVKTSTGYGSGGATLDDVRLMKRTVTQNVRIKAAGGIRTLDALLAFKKAGVERIGATATSVIMEEAIRRQNNGTLEY